MTSLALSDVPAAAKSQAGKPAASGAYFFETVTAVRHWTPRLMSLTVTRDPAFRFASGQFTMIGLEVGGRPLVRAFSMTSAVYDDFLEFYSIKMPDGPLTSRLQHVEPGDRLLVGRKPTGTLIADNLRPGRRLYLFSTGTGIAPFASLIKDPDIYDRFERVVLVHGCREIDDLAFGETTVTGVKESEALGEIAAERLIHVSAVSRASWPLQGRVTDLVTSGRLAAHLGLPPLSPAEDRVMLCGSPGMLADMRGIATGLGFTEGSGGKPGEFVIEKAFVER